MSKSFFIKAIFLGIAVLAVQGLKACPGGYTEEIKPDSWLKPKKSKLEIDEEIFIDEFTSK